MNRKWQYLLLAVAVVSISIAAFLLLRPADGQMSKHAGAQMKEKTEYGKRWSGMSANTSPQLTVAVLPTLDCLPVALAYEKGWFESNGVRVNLLCLNAQMDCDTALTGGSTQIAVTDIVRRERLEKKGISLTVLTQTGLQWQLIANKNTRLTGINQLGDKMVAMTRYSATDNLTTQMEQQAKAKNHIFRVQVNDLHVRLKMLLTGAMDVAWLPEPQATAAKVAGHKVLPFQQDEQKQYGVFVYRSDTYNRKYIDGFLKSYNQAVDSLNRYGVVKYADVCENLTQVTQNIIRKLPKQTFRHASPTF